MPSTYQCSVNVHCYYHFHLLSSCSRAGWVGLAAVLLTAHSEVLGIVLEYHKNVTPITSFFIFYNTLVIFSFLLGQKVLWGFSSLPSHALSLSLTIPLHVALLTCAFPHMWYVALVHAIPSEVCPSPSVSCPSPIQLIPTPSRPSSSIEPWGNLPEHTLFLLSSLIKTAFPWVPCALCAHVASSLWAVTEDHILFLFTPPVLGIELMNNWWLNTWDALCRLFPGPTQLAG